jgi:hypothetical protein
MPETFTYKARDRTGKVVSGELVGDSEALVIAKLREQAMVPIEVGKKNAGMKRELRLRPAKVKLKVMSVFSRQFATMIDAGLNVVTALTILEEQTDDRHLASVISEVRAGAQRSRRLPRRRLDARPARVRNREPGHGAVGARSGNDDHRLPSRVRGGASAGICDRFTPETAEPPTGCSGSTSEMKRSGYE